MHSFHKSLPFATSKDERLTVLFHFIHLAPHAEGQSLSLILLDWDSMNLSLKENYVLPANFQATQYKALNLEWPKPGEGRTELMGVKGAVWKTSHCTAKVEINTIRKNIYEQGSLVQSTTSSVSHKVPGFPPSETNSLGPTYLSALHAGMPWNEVTF